MTRVVGGLRAFAAFWWDFVVGDDWTVAAGVVVALALTAVLTVADIPAWWLLPLAALITLALSLRRAIGGARKNRTEINSVGHP